jgi:hypothetical protein
MFLHAASDMDRVSVPTVARCPECGSEVILSAEALSGWVEPSPEDLDRLAHALCGCYVLSMSSRSLARLFISLLAVDDRESETV